LTTLFPGSTGVSADPAMAGWEGALFFLKPLDLLENWLYTVFTRVK
jgi:hypothetical protein